MTEWLNFHFSLFMHDHPPHPASLELTGLKQGVGWRGLTLFSPVYRQVVSLGKIIASICGPHDIYIRITWGVSLKLNLPVGASEPAFPSKLWRGCFCRLQVWKPLQLLHAIVRAVKSQICRAYSRLESQVKVLSLKAGKQAGFLHCGLEAKFLLLWETSAFVFKVFHW